MIEWNPIESAPKNGTVILLYVEDVAIEGWWQNEGWKVESTSYHGCGCCSFENEPASHWAELNKPLLEKERDDV